MISDLWLIGCGNMGGAMLARWLATGLDPAQVTVVRPSGVLPAAGVRMLSTVPDGASPAAMVLLAVKPQMLDAVAGEVARLCGPETLLVSILAGVGLCDLRRRFPRVGAVARAMPNTPVAIGRGVVLTTTVPETHAATLGALFAPLGHVERTDDEQQFDRATALAGCGPAFLFRFVDALADAGAALGLEPEQALRLALATVDGAAGLARMGDETPGRLADRVASPGGMTREGLNVLDEGQALRDLLRRTLAAADARGQALAEAARQSSPDNTAQ